MKDTPVFCGALPAQARIDETDFLIKFASVMFFQESAERLFGLYTLALCERITHKQEASFTRWFLARELSVSQPKVIRHELVLILDVRPEIPTVLPVCRLERRIGREPEQTEQLINDEHQQHGDKDV
ncbi:MAG: hypothetical protein QNJ87_00055 [Gammaproteobacteria bacterium]|nr:hypothetical protein [Gammaproteobacteria bacterium]